MGCKHLFVLNPTAGKQDSTNILRREIEEIASARGLEYRIAVTERHGHAVEIAREAASTGDELRLYACGGDGTLNEVINGAAGFANAAVTNVPCGSGNDFVKTFSEPMAFRNLGRLMEPEEATFDLIHANESISLNICSVGFDARIGTDMVRYKHLPLVTGPGAYALSVAVNLIKGVHEHYRIELEDGTVLDDRYTLACMCNGRWYGGGYQPLPESDPADGWMDVLLIKAVSRLTVANLISKFKVGQYQALGDLATHLQCRSLTIHADHVLPVNLDGELLRAQDVKFWLEPQAMRVFYPHGLKWHPAVAAPANT